MLSTVSAEPSEPDRSAAGATVYRLLDAAAEAFSARGFHGTTTRDIASRAGLSPAGVYVHFSTKEALLFALSKRGHETARDLIGDAARSGSTPSEALLAVLSTFAQWHAEHFRVARIVQYEFPHLTPEHRERVLGLRKEIDQVTRDILTRGVQSGEFTVEDVPDTALTLMSMVVDVCRWYDPEIRRDPSAIGATIGSLGLRMVTARPAAIARLNGPPA